MCDYTKVLIERIWRKAKIIDGFDETRWRQDFAGAWIQKDQYGIQSAYGWEIDHLIPHSHGGTDEIDNLQPLHWENNRMKGADTPIFKTIITSKDKKNVKEIKTWQISKK